jgi:hypothetical protein
MDEKNEERFINRSCMFLHPTLAADPEHHDERHQQHD